MSRLPEEFYQSRDVVLAARDLIGKKLVSNCGGEITSGLITETEAYHQSEKACHAYNGRFTQRTRVLFEPGGIAYVYLCYGIHHLLNVTTGKEGEAAAVLIRAIQPLDGIPSMLARRSLKVPGPRISDGPGKLAEAFGVTMAHNGKSLVHGESLWIEESNSQSSIQITATPRIGVDYAEEDASLPWRFYLNANKYVSKS